MKRSGRALAGGAACAALLYVASVAGPAPALADVPLCGGRPATIVGSEGVDYLSGTPGDDVIVGLGGNDHIDAGDGDDRVCGGTGKDRIIAGNGVDRLFGGPNKDRLSGYAGDGEYLAGEGGSDNLSLDGPRTTKPDHCVGGQGRDSLVCVTGASLVEGGTGNDRIMASVRGPGPFTGAVWRGGEGQDSLVLGAFAPVGTATLDLSLGTGSIEGHPVDFAEFESANVRGARLELIGSDQDEILVLSLTAPPGTDSWGRVTGGAGDDLVGAHQYGAHIVPVDLDGGPGTDIAAIWTTVPFGSTEPDELWFDLSTSTWGTPSRGTLGSVEGEQLSAEAHQLTIAGSSESDVVEFSADRATVSAGLGDDIIFVAPYTHGAEMLVRGGPGDDQLTGARAVSRFYGGSGDDVLTGDRADDDLRGGTGSDEIDGGDGLDRCRAEVKVNCER